MQVSLSGHILLSCLSQFGIVIADMLAPNFYSTKEMLEADCIYVHGHDSVLRTLSIEIRGLLVKLGIQISDIITIRSR